MSKKRALVGDRREIAGYDAERFIVTVEIGGEVATEEGTTVLPGTMVLLSDVWTNREFPADRLAAANAVRGALGRFGLGRKEEKEETVETDPTQAIVMRITDRVTAVEEGDLPSETFLPPQSYEERVPEWLTAGVSR